MSINFTNALGVQPEALALRARRAEIIAGNLANADTPGYQARDIPFAELMAGTAKHALPLAHSNAAHLVPPVGDRDLSLMYRTPLQPAVDGNTVDGDMEMAQFAQNNLAFEASFNFLNGRFRSLISAIRGE